MVTIKEIAKRCNVSATTVSNIINGKAKASEKTVQMVMDAVNEMGYHPNYIARGLRSNRTKTIGIIAEDIAQFTTPDIIESVMALCEEKGYRTVVQNLRLYARWSDKWYAREADYYSVLEPVLKNFMSMKVDGILYIAGHARIIRLFSENVNIPSVVAYAYSASESIPSVVIDDETSAYEMTKYLIEMGHKKIGVIGGRADNIHTQKRLKGYQKALYEEKLLFDPDLIYNGNWKRTDGYQGTEALLKKGVTVLFSMSDQMAGGVYDYLQERDLKIGEDMSVVGFDDWVSAAYFTPKLTTTKLPLSEIGQEAAKLLFQILDGEVIADGREIKIPCEMQIRNSVKKIV